MNMDRLPSSGFYSWPFTLITLSMLMTTSTTLFTPPDSSSASPPLTILEHVASPSPLVANCSQTSLTCKISSPSLRSSDIVVYWTFRGDNASKLPDIEYASNSGSNVWQLILSCPTLSHSGTYACIAHPSNDSSIVDKKEAVIQVYVPISIRVTPEFPSSGSGGLLISPVGQSAQVKCTVSSFPKATIWWERLVQVDGGRQDFIRVQEDKSRIRISETREISETVRESVLSFHAISREDDNVTFICRAKNAYSNESAASIMMKVQQPPEVRLDKIEMIPPAPAGEGTPSAVVYWTVEEDADSPPVKSLILQVKNYSREEPEWNSIDTHDIEAPIPSSMSSSGSFVVSYLAPAVTYGFQLAAVNEVGQSDWVSVNATTPADVPAIVSELRVLAKTNETLLIGWKRPAENGAVITKYEMTLRDAKDNIVSQQTMDVEVNSTKVRNNYMYIFVNLSPGSLYSFKVRACSSVGCGNWSSPGLEASTADGHADPPTSVAAICSLEPSDHHHQHHLREKMTPRSTVNRFMVTWKRPENPRGIVLGFNVTLEGYSRFRNEMSLIIVDQFKESFVVDGSDSNTFTGLLRPNTNYTIRVCTINRSGCGSYSAITAHTTCTTPGELPSLPPVKEGLKLSLMSDPSTALNGRRLQISFPRLSERNGTIACYRVVIIRLPDSRQSLVASLSSHPLDLLPRDPRDLNITTYEQVHRDVIFFQQREQQQQQQNQRSESNLNLSPESHVSNWTPSSILGAYVPEEIDPSEPVTDVIIGDDNFKKCTFSSQTTSSSLEESLRTPRRIKTPSFISIDPFSNNNRDTPPSSSSNSPSSSFLPSPSFIPADNHHNHLHRERNNVLLVDGILAPSTNYTGFLEVQVIGKEGVLTQQSSYFPPITTGALLPPTPSTTPLPPINTKYPANIISQSPFAPILSTVTESANAVVFGVVSGAGLILLLLVVVLAFLKRKVSESTTSRSDTDSQSDDNLSMGGMSSMHKTLPKEASVSLPPPQFISTTTTLSSLQHATSNGTMNGRIPHNCHNSNNRVDTVCSHKWIGQPIYLPDLPIVFMERHADCDLLFEAEFDSLPEHFPDRTAIASDLFENSRKNRYPDIKSFDQTRVRLPLTEDGTLGSDYINADFVEGYKGRKLYICAQGPLDNTITDFWRMIYEHKVSVVVMLTGIEEQGKIKCSQYWSDVEGQPFLVSNLYAVTLLSTRLHPDFLIRRLRLKRQNQTDEEGRDVLQFHFLMWKDFLAPEQPSWMLRFVKRVNEYYCPDKGPLLVHCSAGVGRTGTFVAIDCLLPEVQTGDFVNVWECVAHLRYQRNFLVQSLKQYIFVYRAVMEYSQFGDTEVEVCHLSDHYKQLQEQRYAGIEVNGLIAEFDRLSAVVEDVKSACVASLDMNSKRNRYDFVVPYDVNRVILSTSSPDQTSYINASFIQGYDRASSFIITQDPLQSTINEFWRMITEQSIQTVVMLSDVSTGVEEDEGDEYTRCPKYWPGGVGVVPNEVGNDEGTYGKIHVKRETETSVGSFIRRTFSVTDTTTKETRSLTQLQFLSWQPKVLVPDSTLLFLQLIETAFDANADAATAVSSSTSSSHNNTCSPIVVHCPGGGDNERSSVFVTLMSLLRQLMLEQRVDVFQSARFTRSQRVFMLQSLAQYDFLYRSLIDYIESRNVCDLRDTLL